MIPTPFIISFAGCFRRLKSALEPEQRIAQVTLAADLEGKPFVGLHVSRLDARLLQRRSSPPGIFRQLEDHGMRATQRARFRHRGKDGFAAIKASKAKHWLGGHAGPLDQFLRQHRRPALHLGRELVEARHGRCGRSPVFAIAGHGQRGGIGVEDCLAGGSKEGAGSRSTSRIRLTWFLAKGFISPPIRTVTCKASIEITSPLTDVPSRNSTVSVLRPPNSKLMLPPEASFGPI